MKKVTSKETFDFLISGIKGTSSENSVTIGPKGVEVDDQDALLIQERFGSNVEITNVDAKAAKSDDKKDTDASDDKDKKDADTEGKKDDGKKAASKGK